MPMPIVQPLDALPLWALFVAASVVVFASVEAGFRLGLHKRGQTEGMKDAAAGAMVGATLGLLAFMLAFTFSMAATRLDNRKALILDEANAVQTTYLRAGFIAEPQRSEIRALLREYVNVRVDGANLEKVGETISRSEQILVQVWSRAVAAAELNSDSIPTGLFVESLNEVIVIHAKRVKAALRSRIPAVIIYVLYFVMTLAMVSMGYVAGLGGKRTPPVTYALVLAFSSVLFLINDLDRPLEGALTASQQPLLDLREKVVAPAP